MELYWTLFEFALFIQLVFAIFLGHLLGYYLSGTSIKYNYHGGIQWFDSNLLDPQSICSQGISSKKFQLFSFQGSSWKEPKSVQNNTENLSVSKIRSTNFMIRNPTSLQGESIRNPYSIKKLKTIVNTSVNTTNIQELETSSKN